MDDKKLKYSQLGAFDKAMITQLRGISGDVEYSYVHQDDHVLSYARGDKLIVYNFSPTDSYTEYALPVPRSNTTSHCHRMRLRLVVTIVLIRGWSMKQLTGT